MSDDKQPIDVDAALADLDRGKMPDWITAHLDTYQQSGGRDGHMWDSSAAGGPGLLPTLLLTTRGRRSGAPRIAPLIYGEADGAYVIVASKGGAPESPAWLHNLVADPTVHLQVGEEKFSATAAVATGSEREQLWDLMVDVYPPYADYQQKTTREIPIVTLRRA